MDDSAKSLRIEISACWARDGQTEPGPFPVVTADIDTALLDLCPDKLQFITQQLAPHIQMLLMEHGVIERR